MPAMRRTERKDIEGEIKEKLMRLWAESSFGPLGLPEEEVFNVEHQEIQVPAFAPIFASVKCSVCGENIMETKARIRNGEPICIACASAEHYQLDGAGISVQTLTGGES